MIGSLPAALAWHGLAGSKSVLKLVIIVHVGTPRTENTTPAMRKIIKIRTTASWQNINILHHYMLTGISDGGFDTKHLNIIYYQTINQIILMDILQQSILHIYIAILCIEKVQMNDYTILKYPDLFQNILRRSLQERLTTRLQEALLNIPHNFTLHLPSIWTWTQLCNEIYLLSSILVSELLTKER